LPKLYDCKLVNILFLRVTV
jgi:hypothetical protein